MNHLIFRIKKIRIKKHYIAICLLAFLFSIPTIIYFNKVNSVKAAAWFNDAWAYRAPLTITNSSGGVLTDYQIKVTVASNTLYSAGKVQADCDDLRFTDINGKLLPYWIEDTGNATDAVTCNTAAIDVWIKIPSIPTSGIVLYMYYGNPTAVAKSNGNAVFDFFDDFAAFDTTRWAGTGTGSLSGGELTSITGSNYTNNTILSTAQGYVYEQRVKWTSTTGSYSGLIIGKDQDIQGSNAGQDALVTLMSTSLATYDILGYAADGTTTSYNIASGPTQYTATASTFHVSGFSVDSSNIRFYNNRTQTNSYAGTWTNAPYMYLGHFQGSTAGNTDVKDMTTDWVLARKYASSVPTASTGSEESGPGPLLYFRFDEGFGTTTYDNTGAGNNGTLTNGPVWEPDNECVAGKCLFFDGTNDYVDAGTSPMLTLTNQVTLSAWINMNTVPNTNAFIISKAQECNNEANYNLLVKGGGNLAFSYYDGTGSNNFYSSTTTLSYNRWYHVSATYNFSTYAIQLYIDGKPVSGSWDSSNTPNNTSPTTTTNNLRIGATRVYSATGSCTGSAVGDPLYLFKGKIDDVKVYQYIRTSDQIKQDYGNRGSTKGSSSVIGVSDNGKNLTDGLIGWWKMDESAANSCAGGANDNCDSSGNGNDGAWNGNATVGPGKFGYGAAYDGTGDYTSINDNALVSPTSQITIAGWIYRSSVGSADALLGKYVSGSNRRSYLLGMNTTLPQFILSSNGTATATVLGTTTVVAGTWTHIAATYDGKTMKIFVNGNLEGSTQYTGGIYDSTDALRIGDGDQAGWYLNGRVDDVRLYNRGLSDDEIKAIYNYAAPPIMYLDLNEGVGTSANDSSGNSLTGALTNGPTWVKGKFGGAVSFDAANDYINIPDAAVMDQTSLTLSGWFYPKSFTAADKLFVRDDGSSNRFWQVQVLDTTGKLQVLGNAGGLWGYNISTTSGLTLNQWNHVSVTMDATTDTAYVYINGVQVGTDTATGDLSTGARAIEIAGSSAASTNALDGYVDEIKMYSYARSPQQVLEDMNAGHPVGGSPVGSQLVYWNFDEGYGSTLNNVGNGGTAYNASMGVGVSAPTWSNDGKLGKALTFDGVYDYITSGTAISKPLNYTISAWIKPSAWGNSAIAESNSAGSNSTVWGIVLRDTGDAVEVWTSNGTSGQQAVVASDWNSTGFPSSQWTHIAATVDGSYIRYYKNGKLINTTAQTIQNSGTASGFSVGRLGVSNSFYYNGLIDEVKVYTGALTADQIKIDYNLGKSLVLGSVSTDSGVESGSNASSREYCVPGDSSTCSSPIGEWKFDEKTGTTANDTSTNGFTGTLTNGPVWQTGKVGPALNFDGADDYVSITDNSSLEGFTTMTISAWVNPETCSGIDDIVNKESNTYVFRLDGCQFDAGVYTSGWVTLKDNAALSANKWYYLVMTYDGSRVKLYKNGQYISSFTNSNGASAVQTGTVSTNAANLLIGANAAGNVRYFDGAIDQVRIYNYARTQSQIAWEYNKGAPVLYYKLDECQGSTAYNSALGSDGLPLGNNGTVSIGASGTNTSAGTCAGSAGEAWKDGSSGKINGSLEFDGTDDVINMTDLSMLASGTAPRSMCAWMNTQITDSNYRMAASYGTNSNSQAMFIGQNGTTLYGGGWADDLTVSNFFTIGVWNHVCLTYDGTTAIMYTNGKSATSGSKTWNLTATYGNIGKQVVNAEYWKGQVDEVKVFNYTLTATQVKQLYNTGAVYFQ